MKNFSPSILEKPEVEPWPEPVDGQMLLEQLTARLRGFVILPQWAPETLALFTIHTYAFQLRDVSTYLGIESPEKRCGKTTLLGVLGKLVHRPIVAANISSSAFFRVIQEVQPTLLIDEADTFLKRKSDLRGILNAGYTRDTAYVMRVASEKSGGKRSEGTGSRLVKFSCFCPKVMAAIGQLPETLADRCIIIRMQRKTVQEQCERLRDLEATALRRQCLRFVQDHAQEIATARPAMPPSLNDREADIWEPLVVLADVAGGRWPKLARDAAVGLTSSSRENNPIGSLLLDIWVRFLNAKADRMFSRTLVEQLNCLGDRPWAELKKGKPITDLWLAKRLQPYQIRPRTIWIGEEHAKGYYEKDFRVLFHRYVPPSEVDALLAESRPTERGGEKAEGGGPATEGTAEKPNDGDQKSDAGSPPEDSAAAA